jgi:hypothetical protein
MESSKEDKALATSVQKLEAYLSAKFKTMECRVDLIENKLTMSTTSLVSLSQPRPTLDKKGMRMMTPCL